MRPSSHASAPAPALAAAANAAASSREDDALFSSLRARVLHVAGKNGIRACAFALGAPRDAPAVLFDGATFRQRLRDFGVAIPDESFARAAFAARAAGSPGPGACDPHDATIDAARFVALLRGVLVPRRKTAVDAAFQRLDPGRTGFIAVADFERYYDVSRHPKVLARLANADDVAWKFLALFDASTNPDGNVSQDEWRNYYAGFSALEPSDTAFELAIARSWNLDMPSLVTRKEVELSHTQLVASKAARNHPLYQTASQAFGSQLSQAFATVTKYNRAGAFTKNNPSPGPSSGLNASMTRSKVI